MPKTAKKPEEGTQSEETTLSKGEVEALNVHQRLLEVKKTVEFLKKENSGNQYKFVSSSQTILSIREKMNEYGLLLIPSITGSKYNIISESDKGSKTILTELEMTYTWLCADKPEDKLEVSWYGQGVDIQGEKGVGKALTYSEKYFLLKFFNIATDNDDPDAHQEAPAPQKRGYGAPARASAPAPAPAPQERTGELSNKPQSVTTKQVNMINVLCAQVGVDREKYKQILKVESMNDLSMARASKVIDALLEKKKQQELNGGKDLPAISYDEEDDGVDVNEIPD